MARVARVATVATTDHNDPAAGPGFGPEAKDVQRAVRVVSEGCCPRQSCNHVRLTITELNVSWSKGLWGECPTCRWRYRVGRFLEDYPNPVLQALIPDGPLPSSLVDAVPPTLWMSNWYPTASGHLAWRQ